MIILDTNVLSEILRPTPADSVGRLMQAQPSTSLFTTTICEAEIFYGLALMPAGRHAPDWSGRLRLYSKMISQSGFCHSTAQRRARSQQLLRNGEAWVVSSASSMPKSRLLTIRVEPLSQRGMLRISLDAG